MTDTKPDISREAVENLADAVTTEARAALRRDDNTAYLMLLTAAGTLLALREALDKHEASNSYNAMLQLGLMQLLKENGIWPKISDIINAYGRHQIEVQDSLDRGVLNTEET